MPWRDLVQLELELAGQIDSYVFALLESKPVALRSTSVHETYFWNHRIFQAAVLVNSAILVRTPVRTRNWQPHRFWLLVHWWHKSGREQWATRGGTIPDMTDSSDAW